MHPGISDFGDSWNVQKMYILRMDVNDIIPGVISGGGVAERRKA